MNQKILLFIVVNLILLQVACQKSDQVKYLHHSAKIQPVTSPISTTEDIDSLEKTIQQVSLIIKTTIGNAKCSKDSQCRTLAVGHKACGGPQKYLVYSELNTDTGKLVRLSQQHRQLSQTLNRLKGAMSDCTLVSKPAIICFENHCQKID